MRKPTVLYVMYSYHKKAENYDARIVVKLHGIFTEKEVSKYQFERKLAHAECMLVPLNKFIQNGVDL